jgi:hypothetical protein
MIMTQVVKANRHFAFLGGQIGHSVFYDRGLAVQARPHLFFNRVFYTQITKKNSVGYYRAMGLIG